MVGLHATADATGQPFVDYPMGDRIAPMLLRAVIYTARTELFLLISIFLLLMALDKRPKTYGETIRIQCRRLLVPFVFWTVFYAFYGLIKANAFGYDAAIRAELSDPMAWVGYLLLGDVKYHMHFIPTLFGLVLLYPTFRLATRYPALGLLVIACLLIKRELDLFIWSEFWGTDVLPYAVRTVKILTYAGYGIMAGAFYGIWRQVDPRVRGSFVPLIAMFGGLLFLIKLVGTWKTVELGRWPHDFTAGYWADFLMPVVLFALAMCLGHRRWPEILSRLAPYSFGIYLCHPIFLDLVEITIHGMQLGPMAQVSLKIGFAVVATSIFVVALKNLPALAWTVGLGRIPMLEKPAFAPKAGEAR